jgi:GNAT superfamily N-acetyltransferase
MGITTPEPIFPNHNFANFTCGKQALDDWLIKKALKNQTDGGSRSFVVMDSDLDQVVGYYCISTGLISHELAPGNVRRNMPDPIPVILLGRLAVDVGYVNQGIGRGLMKDCYKRAASVAEQVGVRALLVHALDEESRQYYLHLGFTESTIQERTLMLRIKDIVSSLS